MIDTDHRERLALLKAGSTRFEPSFLLGFLEFRQYARFLAYLQVKAGFLDCLLNSIKAERVKKEVQI